MKYYLVRPEIDSAATGISSSKIHAVEIKKKQSFANEKEMEYFYTVLDNAWQNNGFAKFDETISTITLFPTGKKVKELDVITHSPRRLGLDFIVSKKALDLLNLFSLPEHNVRRDKGTFLFVSFNRFSYTFCSSTERWSNAQNKSCAKRCLCVSRYDARNKPVSTLL